MSLHEPTRRRSEYGQLNFPKSKNLKFPQITFRRIAQDANNLVAEQADSGIFYRRADLLIRLCFLQFC